MSISDGTYTVGGSGVADYASVTAALADINQTSTSQLVKLEIIADTTEGAWVLTSYGLLNVKNVEIYNRVKHNGNPLVGPKLVGATVNIFSTTRIVKVHDVYFKNSAIKIGGSADPTYLNFYNGINRIYNLLIEGGSLEMAASDWYVTGFNDTILYDYPTIVNAKIWGMPSYVEITSYNRGWGSAPAQDPYNTVVLENVTIMRSNPSDIGLLYHLGFWDYYPSLPSLYIADAQYNVTNLALVNCTDWAVIDQGNWPGTTTYTANGKIYSTEFESLDPADGADFLKPKASISNSGSVPLVSWNTYDIANKARPWHA